MAYSDNNAHGWAMIAKQDSLLPQTREGAIGCVVSCAEEPRHFSFKVDSIRCKPGHGCIWMLEVTDTLATFEFSSQNKNTILITSIEISEKTECVIDVHDFSKSQRTHCDQKLRFAPLKGSQSSPNVKVKL